MSGVSVHLMIPHHVGGGGGGALQGRQHQEAPVAQAGDQGHDDGCGLHHTVKLCL